MMHILNKGGMRTKIFIFVGILFGVTISCVIVLRYLEVHRVIQTATEEIALFVKKLDYQKREAILQYLNITIVEKENQIRSLFRKINDYDWMKARFLPSQYNYDSNDWKSSSELMMTNQWIDLIQTTDRGKLTSSIVARPPYIKDFICIPVNKVLSVIVAMNEKGIRS